MGFILVKLGSIHSLNEVSVNVKEADTAIWLINPIHFILSHFGGLLIGSVTKPDTFLPSP